MDTHVKEAQINALVVGQIIRLLRERADWTQNDLAERVGMTQSALSRVERGKGRIDPVTFGRLANTFEMDVADLHQHVEDSLERAKQACNGATSSAPSGPWWVTALGVAGVLGLIGLVAFAVAASLNEGSQDDKTNNNEQSLS